MPGTGIDADAWVGRIAEIILGYPILRTGAADIAKLTSAKAQMRRGSACMVPVISLVQQCGWFRRNSTLRFSSHDWHLAHGLCVPRAPKERAVAGAKAMHGNRQLTFRPNHVPKFDACSLRRIQLVVIAVTASNLGGGMDCVWVLFRLRHDRLVFRLRSMQRIAPR